MNYSKRHDWNNYQKLATINALEIKNPFRFSRHNPSEAHTLNDNIHHYASPPLPLSGGTFRFESQSESSLGGVGLTRSASCRLASVKRALYNPALPSLRKMSRDSVLCKLADEHSQHNSAIFAEDEFADEDAYLNAPPAQQHHYFAQNRHILAASNQPVIDQTLDDFNLIHSTRELHRQQRQPFPNVNPFYHPQLAHPHNYAGPTFNYNSGDYGDLGSPHYSRPQTTHYRASPKLSRSTTVRDHVTRPSIGPVVDRFDTYLSTYGNYKTKLEPIVTF